MWHILRADGAPSENMRKHGVHELFATNGMRLTTNIERFGNFGGDLGCLFGTFQTHFRNNGPGRADLQEPIEAPLGSFAGAWEWMSGRSGESLFVDFGRCCGSLEGVDWAGPSSIFELPCCDPSAT